MGFMGQVQNVEALVDSKAIRIDRIENRWLDEMGIRLSMLRLDLMDSLISGNKWFKLVGHFRGAKMADQRAIVTLGGAWSNHLIATAKACQLMGWSSLGIVRRPYSGSLDSPTIKACKMAGMKIKWVTAELYRQYTSPNYKEQLQKHYPYAWIIPEGGNDAWGRAGLHELAALIPPEVNYVALAIGTGTTLGGLCQAMPHRKGWLGFAPFKKVAHQEKALKELLKQDLTQLNCRLFCDTVWKGFGTYDDRLIDFMNQFYEEQNIPLDLVYTAKLMFYLKQLIQQGQFLPGSHLLAIHSGGLQGNASVASQLCY